MGAGAFQNTVHAMDIQVEPGTCLQKLVGSVRTGVILKDVSLEVHGGELTAVLGSKGKMQFEIFSVNTYVDRFWKACIAGSYIKESARSN